MGKRIFSSFQKHLPNHRITMVFDVGANVGDATAAILAFYPDSQVCAFEPVQATFDECKTRFGDHPNITVNRLALSSQCDVGSITASGISPNNGLVEESEAGGRQTEAVEILTGDVYCERNSIRSISYLAVDTGGGDLDVLRGFHRMIGSQLIDVIRVEASMSASNRRLVPFDTFRGYLEGSGYALFGLYNQGHDGGGRPVLRRSSLVFLSREVVDANTLGRKSTRLSGENANQ